MAITAISTINTVVAASIPEFLVPVSRLRFDIKWPGLVSSSADGGMRNARRSPSDIESANRGDPAVEMVLHAEGPAPARENVFRITTTVEII